MTLLPVSTPSLVKLLGRTLGPRLVVPLFALLGLVAPVRAEAPPTARPESVGVSSERLQRLSAAKIERATDPKTGQGHYVEGPRVAFAGGAGLLSTARDYARFLELMLNRGELDGVRLLGPKTVELMTANHVGALFAESEPVNAGMGFGLGFDVVLDLGASGRHGSEEAFGWGGAYHTTYWVDPREKLVAVLMTQLLPATGSSLHGRFRALVYQAIVGPPPAGPVARR